MHGLNFGYIHDKLKGEAMRVENNEIYLKGGGCSGWTISCWILADL